MHIVQGDDGLYLEQPGTSQMVVKIMPLSLKNAATLNQCNNTQFLFHNPTSPQMEMNFACSGIFIYFS